MLFHKLRTSCNLTKCLIYDKSNAIGELDEITQKSQKYKRPEFRVEEVNKCDGSKRKIEYSRNNQGFNLIILLLLLFFFFIII